MQVIVNNTDITGYIVEGSYKMNTHKTGPSWQDGNYLTHQKVVTEKIEGSFQVVCSNRANSITLSAFLTLWDGAVTDNYVTLGCTVLNKGAFEAVQAMYTIENVKHIKSGDGSMIDVLEIKITER